MGEGAGLLGRYAQWSGLVGAVLHIVLILLVASLMLWLSRRLIRALRRQMQQRASDPEQIKRLETLARVVRYVCAVVIASVSGLLVLAELGVSIAPLLASAGVIGIAVGFGAQSLIRDYFNGLFMLLENQLCQGDVVELGGKAGLVEEITLRHIRLRDYEGNVHFIPSGAVTTVTNCSRGFAYAVAEVRVAYREDIDAVLDIMREVGGQMRGDPVLAPMILGDIEIAGVEKWAESAIVLGCRFRVRPLQQWTVRREYLRRLKKRFDSIGIEIPYPQRVVHHEYREADACVAAEALP